MTVTKFHRFALFVFALGVISSPARAEDFQPFAAHQDSLMMQDYTRRDVSAFRAHLGGLLDRFTLLDAEAQKRYGGYVSGAFYNFACTYALVGGRDSAITYLRKSVDAGYSDYRHLLEDSDLVTLHGDTEFTALYDRLRSSFDYLAILSHAGTYDTTDARPFPPFTYQARDDSSLVALRSGLRLDSIAGRGNDVSQVLSLLHWIHNLIPHQGDRNNPEVMNAMSLIQVCRQEGRGLNCRGLSTVLNECYLSLGFASRFVTCLPKDSLGIDPDCHVITMVFVPSLKKWIWVDPTNDAYVMNEKGELLGIDEVRERLVGGKPVILNPDANWNHRSSVTREEYLFSYMAKNLYRLECSVDSRHDLESPGAGRTNSYVILLPCEFFAQKPDVSTRKGSSATIMEYRTNNPRLFWAPPPEALSR
jgi:hypothetical protein